MSKFGAKVVCGTVAVIAWVAIQFVAFFAMVAVIDLFGKWSGVHMLVLLVGMLVSFIIASGVCDWLERRLRRRWFGLTR